MASADDAASSAGEPASPPPSFSDMLAHSASTAFAVLCAATSRALYVSPNAAMVLGVEPAAVEGRLLAALSGSVLHATDLAAVQAAMARARAAGPDAQPERVEARRRISSSAGLAVEPERATASDSDRPSAWAWTELKFSCDGEYVYVTARDASEERRTEELLRSFLLTASHDMRTPVNGMSCAAQLLAACPAVAEDADALALLATVRASCALMIATIDSVLDMRPRAAAAAASAPRRGPVDVRDVLDEVLETCRTGLARPFDLLPPAGGANGSDACFAAGLWGDAAAVRQTLLNLAMVCAQHAPPGGRCTAELRCSRDDAPGVVLETRFRAHGAAPLGDAELASAFDVHGGDGTGLALNVARRLARAAGGDAALANEPGGVLFSAKLRLDDSQEKKSRGDDDGAPAPMTAGELAHAPVEEHDASVVAGAPGGPTTLALTARTLEHLVRTSDEMYHVGTIGPGGDFKFAFVSPTVERIFGWSASDVLTQNPMAFTHADDVPRCVAVFVGALTRLAETGEEHAAVAVTRRFRAADGGYKWCRTMGCVTPTRWVLMCKDMSSQFARDDALRRLLLCVSRRLREPANAVLAARELLAARLAGSSAEVTHLLDAMGASCRLLLSLVANVMSARTADQDAQPPSEESFDPRAAALDVVDVLRTLHGAQTLADVDFSDGPPGVVEGADCTLFSQIVMNLVGNACKFQAGRGVRVRMRCEPAAASPSDASSTPQLLHQLVVSVTDFGRGVSDDEAARVFAPYEAAPAAHGGGTGLGLFVARRAARRMGGDVTLLRAPPGGGTTFTLRLPVRVPAAARDAVSAAAVPEPSSTPQAAPPLRIAPPPAAAAASRAGMPLRCLLVDDQAINLRLVSRLLQHAGFASVETAADGAQALRMLQAAFAAGAPPHAVLMDMAMPVMTGPESAAAFRLWEAQRCDEGPGQASALRLPIVCFTANMLAEQHAECLAAGMDAVATKPLQRRDVDALLRRAEAYAAQRAL